MTCQRVYNFDFGAYKSFFENDSQTTKKQYDKKNGLQPLFQLIRLKAQLLAEFAAALVDGIDAQVQKLAHLRVGDVAAREQTDLGIRLVQVGIKLADFRL